jgi:ketosteroid isomerase-like protein
MQGFVEERMQVQEDLHHNAKLISKFYTAMQHRDSEVMASCYDDKIHFSDPVFSSLDGEDARDMWRNLMGAVDPVHWHVVISEIEADDDVGSAHWVATYKFGKTGNIVTNDIRAKFIFNKEGKIIDHKDSFDLYMWTRQAIGWSGFFMGWTSYFQNQVREQARRGLARFQSKKSKENEGSPTSADKM